MSFVSIRLRRLTPLLHRTGLALLAVVSLGTGLASPQQPATLVSTARLVVLDVAVTDKTGKPVDDLTEQDFEVFESGAKQRVVSFEAPSAHTLPPGNAGAAAQFDPAHPAAFGQSPVNIFVLDQANTHFEDSSFAKRSLRAYFSAQPPVLSQPATLMDVYDGHFKQLQGFTRDRDVLLRALDKAPTEYAWKLEVYGKTGAGPLERLDQCLTALEQMAQSYARIPGRKNLIWVGGGFPTVDPTVLTDRDAQKIEDTLRHVTDMLIDTHMTLYAVDPTSSTAGVSEITDPVQLEFAQATGDALTTGSDPFNANADFKKLGTASGGQVIRGKNDVARQIAAAIDLGAHFYTVAYKPTVAVTQKASFRSIRIVCLRPGLTATTRSGYYPVPKRMTVDSTKSLDATTYDLTAAAESPLQLNGLQVSAEPIGSSSTDRTYLVRVSRPTLTWKEELDGGASASVYVMAVSLSASREMLSHTVQSMTANAKPQANLSDPSQTADFRVSVPLSRKAKTVRLIVRDSASGKMASVDLPATPDAPAR